MAGSDETLDWQITEEEQKKLTLDLRKKDIAYLQPHWFDEPRFADDLVHIDLSHNGLELVPEVLIWGLPALQSLNLSHNKLITVPGPSSTNQDKFPKLIILDVSDNLLETFPPAICHMTSLVNLKLNNNRISSLPPATRDWSLYHLRSLDMSHNLLVHESLQFYERKTSSAKGWFTRREEEELSVSLREIEFPQCVCSSLISLNLSDNPLMDLPWSIFEMKQLQVLNLDRLEHLKQLPNDLAKSNNLHMLTLEGTNISSPPEIKKLKGEAQSTNLIKHLLWNKLYDCRPSSAMKLIIVGPEKSGKTNLLTRLTDSTWPTEDKGVNVHDWNLTFSKFQWVGSPEEIQFTVWDLKGEASYSTVNQCMLTSRAMYILVWDLRNGPEESKKLKQWILNIKSQCRRLESRIIIAGSHLDIIRRKSKIKKMEHKTKTDVGFYSHQLIGDKFPDLREQMIDIDGEDTGLKSIVNLKRLIYCTASKMKYRSRLNAPVQPFVGRQVPGVHMTLMDRVNAKAKIHKENGTPPIMTEAELLDVIATIPSHRIETPRELDDAVQYLQDCGTVLRIIDHTYRLTTLYFLDPSWLCDALIDAMQVKITPYEQELPDGIVSTGRLKDIGKSQGFTDETAEDYLQLLARFEIAFPHSAGRHLIVAKLPSALVMDPVAIPTCCNTLHRWYKMANIPAGFWSRLVSRIRRDTKRINEDSTHRSLSPTFDGHGPLHLKEAYIAVAQRDIFIHHREGEIRVEPMRFPDGYNGIRLTVRCEQKSFRPMGYLVSHIENLIDEWYPALRDDGSIRCLIPCPVCKSTTPEPDCDDTNNIDDIPQYHVFPFGKLAVSATIRNESSVICPRHKDIPVPLKELVPDLFLVDLDIHYLDEGQLVSKDKLGQGGFGEVLLATYQGKQVALKRFLTKDFNRAAAEISEEEVFAVLDCIPKLRVEVAMMSRLRHPYILKLLGVSIHSLSFIMEFAPLGDLFSEIKRQYRARKLDSHSNAIVHGTLLPKQITYKICLQIIIALQYMHQEKIIHTDIKTDNVLLFSLDPKDEINVKLADYGIAHSLDETGVRGLGGLHVFCAPEITVGKAFKEKVDIFSLGMLIYHVMSGVIPFQDIGDCVQVRQLLSAGTRPTFSHRTYRMIPHFEYLQSVSERCWQNSPHQRPSASELLDVMRDSSFMCLKQVMKVSESKDAILYADSSTEYETKKTHFLFQWHGDGERRCFTVYDTNTLTERTDVFPGDRVNCALVHGNTHILGITEQTERKAIDIYVFVEETWRLSHSARRKVSNTVCTMCYSLDSNKQINQLFVGQDTGTVSIFKPTSVALATTRFVSLHQLPKNLTMCITPRSCTCMCLSADCSCVIVGCGNRLYFVTTENFLLEEKSILVTHNDEEVVDGLAAVGNDIWCCFRGSSMVACYNVRSRTLLTTVDTCIHTSELTSSSCDTSLSQVANEATVSAILRVGDTLWIGRSDGSILVIEIKQNESEENEVRHTRTLAILTTEIMSNESQSDVGAIRNLNIIGNSIVAHAETVAGSNEKLLVTWEKWSAKDFKHFTHKYTVS